MSVSRGAPPCNNPPYTPFLRITHYKNVTNVTNVTDVTNMILVTFEMLGYALNVVYKIVTNGTIRTLGTSKMIHYVSDAMHVNITNGILFANFIRFMEFIHTMRRVKKFFK